MTPYQPQPNPIEFLLATRHSVTLARNCGNTRYKTRYIHVDNIPNAATVARIRFNSSQTDAVPPST